MTGCTQSTLSWWNLRAAVDLAEVLTPKALSLTQPLHLILDVGGQQRDTVGTPEIASHEVQHDGVYTKYIELVESPCRCRSRRSTDAQSPFPNTTVTSHFGCRRSAKRHSWHAGDSVARG